MSGDLLWQVIGFLVTAGAVYGGIRNDLKAMHGHIERHEKAIDKLHERMDGCMICNGRRHADK